MVESSHLLHFGMSCAMEWGQMCNCHGSSQLKLAGHLNMPEVMGHSYLAQMGDTYLSGGKVGIISSWTVSLVLGPGCAGMCF